MATVRLTKKLINRIVMIADDKMTPAVTKAEESKPDNAWGQRIYDTLFLEVKPTIAQVPAGWLKTVEQLEIERVGDVRCDMRFTFKPPVVWPNIFVDTDRAKKESSYSTGIVLTDDDVWSEFYTEVVAYNQRVAIALVHRTELIQMVYNICETYSTLAPALKAWPPLWELTPEDVKDKHREP